MGRAGAAVRILVVLVILGLAAVGWYYSNQILGPDAPPPIDEVAVLAATDTSVTLTPDPTHDVVASGVSTLEWPGGRGEMSEHLSRAGDRVTRRFRLFAGRVPVGGRAGARPFPFAATPWTLDRLPFDSVSIATPVGPCPAWSIPAASDSDWVIFVHGRGSVRAQSLRIAPVLHRMGWNVLAISYRNDPDAARADGGRYRLGATEWEDLEAAVRRVEEKGAKHVVLVGYSGGALISMEFLRHSQLAGAVEAAIFDSPVVRWRGVFDLAARQRGVPAALTSLGMAITSWRAGTDWGELDQLAHAGEIHVPVLIFQGTADPVVPPALADSLAARLGERATLVRVLGAGHVRSWNVGPSVYEATVESWLGRIRGEHRAGRALRR